MPTVEKFRKTLKAHGFDDAICAAVDAGFEGLSDRSKKQEKRDYFAHTMTVLEQNADREAVTALLDDTGCCKAGTAREKASKVFAKAHTGQSLEQRLPYIKDVPHMGEPSLTEDGKLKILAVQYQRDGKYRCACPSINTGKKQETAVPRSYCQCCAGHFRFHYQILLGRQLKLESVLSSPLDTDGREPCGFLFTILPQQEFSADSY